MERKKFNNPDLHAPRCREMIKDILSYPNYDPYRYFARMKEQYPQMKQYSNRQIALWIEDYNKQMAHEVASSRNGVMLPEGLGYVVVGNCKLTEVTAKHNIDYAASSKYGVIINHSNYHCEGYVATIQYYNNIPRQRFKNHELYDFKPCRALSRAVSAEFKAGKYNHFIPLSKWSRVANRFHKFKFRKPSWREKKIERERKEAWANYDEFAVFD